MPVESSKVVQYMMVYHMVGVLWTCNWVEAIAMTTIAGATAAYYWTQPNESGKKKMGRRPVLSALRRTLRYHLGSLALGSALVTAVQLLRAALQYLDKKTQQLQRENATVRTSARATSPPLATATV